MPSVWPAWHRPMVWAPLRWKHAKIHRGSRLRTLRPHQEAGYTSAVVTVAPNPVSLLQSGGVHIRPHMAQSGTWRSHSTMSAFEGEADIDWTSAQRNLLNSSVSQSCD